MPRRRVVVERGIACAACAGSVSQPTTRQRRADVRRARHRHPRLAPDEVEHAARAAAARRGVARRAMRRREVVGERGGLALASEDVAEQRDTAAALSAGIVRMRDDDVRNERARGVDVLAPVLVDVHDEVRRRERAQAREVGILGAADLGHRAALRADECRSRCARRRCRPSSEREQELGQARHQARDARRRPRRRVRDARPVDVGAATSRLSRGCRGLRLRPATHAIVERPRHAAQELPEPAICHGST